MFAKVFSTARGILSRSPSVQDIESGSREGTPRINEPNLEMVTSTRRGPVEDRTPLRTPRSSVRKGKRTLDAEDTPTVSRKKRRSVGKEEAVSESENAPEQIDEGQSETPRPPSILDTIVVRTSAQPSTSDTTVMRELPRQVVEIEQQTTEKEDNLPIRRRASPKVVIEKMSPTIEHPGADVALEEVSSPAQETVFHTPAAQQASSVYATPATTLPVPKHGSPTPKAGTHVGATTSSPSKNWGGKKKRETLNTPVKESDMQDGDHEPGPTQGSQRVASKPNRAHVRFGSEEPVENTHVVAAVAESAAAPVDPDQEDASDSDDAPEEVTAASALTKAKAADADITRAFQAQQEKERQKRKERADRIAEEQQQKRKREEKKNTKKLVTLEDYEGAEVPTESMDVDILNLPTLLPDSLLEAVGDKRPPTPPRLLPGLSATEKRQEKLNRHIKFLERGEGHVKDVKKGSLNVRVLAQENVLLAPKVNRDTKNVREKWLKGRQTEKMQNKGRKKMQLKKMERRPVGGGFLRSED